MCFSPSLSFFFLTFATSVSMPSAHYDKLNKYLTFVTEKVNPVGEDSIGM